MSSTQPAVKPNVRPPPPSKEKSERVTDAVELFTKLNALGVDQSDTSYVVMKFFIDNWVEDGRPRLENVKFSSISKVVQIHLPRFVTQKPIFIIKNA
jgi:hypothetical protein